MAELKTKKTKASVEKFLNTVPDEQRRKDCFRILEIMKTATKSEPAMWGPSIVGFGGYQYKYPNGRELELPLTAFSPRKQALTMYFMPGFFDRYPELMKKLGKHSIAKSCLYIKNLDEVDLTTLKKLIKQSLSDPKAKNK
jgi:hypothetical protein